MIYLVPLLLILIGVYYYDYKKNSKGKLGFLLTIVTILIILGGLHYRVGFDSIQYEKFYDNLKPLNYLTQKSLEASRYAPGFVILASFTKIFCKEPILLYFIISSFVCCSVTLFFVRNTRHVFFALLLFYFFNFTLLIFEQIREAMAVSFFLLAWPAFRSNSWIKWYFLSFCAMAFHASATMMLFLPLILIPGIRNIFIFGRRTWLLVISVLIIALVLQHTFSQYIKLLAVTEAMSDLTQKYTKTRYVEGQLNFVGIGGEILRLVIYPLLAMVILKKRSQLSLNNDELPKLEMFVIICICISILSIGVPIFIRFNNYFFFFVIILLSDIIFQKIIVNKRQIKLSFIGWSIFFVPLFLIQVYTAYFANVDKSGKYKTYMVYYPYTSYLDKQIPPERMIVNRRAPK